MTHDNLDVPEADGADVLHIAVATALSTIPFLGAGELFKFVITPSLEKRREQWMQTVSSAIKDLQARKAIELQDLSENEEFVTLLIKATQIAMNTHLVDKHQLLKSALVNMITVDAEFDIKQLYMSLISDLSPSHIRLLEFCGRNGSNTVGMQEAAEIYVLWTNDAIGNDSLGFGNFIALLCDLEQRGLTIATEGLLTIDKIYSAPYIPYEGYEGDGYPRLTITQVGRDFMAIVGLQ